MSLAELLEKGWIKRSPSLQREGNTYYCLYGGLEKLKLFTKKSLLARVIRELFPERSGSYGDWMVITSFNDHRKTKKDHVLKVAEEFDRRLGVMRRETRR